MSRMTLIVTEKDKTRMVKEAVVEEIQTYSFHLNNESEQFLIADRSIKRVRENKYLPQSLVLKNKMLPFVQQDSEKAEKSPGILFQRRAGAKMWRKVAEKVVVKTPLKVYAFHLNQNKDELLISARSAADVRSHILLPRLINVLGNKLSISPQETSMAIQNEGVLFGRKKGETRWKRKKSPVKKEATLNVYAFHFNGRSEEFVIAAPSLVSLQSHRYTPSRDIIKGNAITVSKKDESDALAVPGTLLVRRAGSVKWSKVAATIDKLDGKKVFAYSLDGIVFQCIVAEDAESASERFGVPGMLLSEAAISIENVHPTVILAMNNPGDVFSSPVDERVSCSVNVVEGALELALEAVTSLSAVVKGYVGLHYSGAEKRSLVAAAKMLTEFPQRIKDSKAVTSSTEHGAIKCCSEKLLFALLRCKTMGDERALVESVKKVLMSKNSKARLQKCINQEYLIATTKKVNKATLKRRRAALMQTHEVLLSLVVANA